MKLNNSLISTAFLLLLSVFSLSSCTDEDGPPEEAPREGEIFFDFRVTGDEGRDDVTCLMRFHEGSLKEEALTLPSGPVEFDGQPVSPDSARITGAYYEVRRPLADFAGVHRVGFTDLNGNKVEQEFTFRPFTLKTDLPARVSRRRFVLDLDGVEAGTRLRLVLTDTSFESPDINTTIRFSGPFSLDSLLQDKVVNGPIILVINSEEESRVTGKARGRISITYGLQREFELVD